MHRYINIFLNKIYLLLLSKNIPILLFVTSKDKEIKKKNRKTAELI